jgi:hypothetical protein
VPLNDLNPEVPQAVSDVLLKGVALRQNERYSTAAEMQRALRRAYNRGESDVPSTKSEQPAAVRHETPSAATSPPVLATAPNFDATIKVSDVVSSPAARQADVKTEVLTQADLGVVESVKTDSSAAANRQSEAPLSSAEKGHSNGKPAVQPPVDSVLTKASAKTTPAKTKSKSGLVAAGLFGLLVVGALAAGGGWYAYQNYYSGKAPRPEPTISSQTPEPIRVADPVANVDVPPTSTAANTAPETNVATADQETSAAPGSVSKPSSVPGKPGATKPGKTSSPKAADKPKPKDDRTVILQ